MASRLISTKHFVTRKSPLRTLATVSANEVQIGKPLFRKVDPLPRALYGGRHTVTMIPGSGLGTDMMAHVRDVFQHCGAPVDFEVMEIDPKNESNQELEYALMSIRRNGVAIKGHLETINPDENIISRNVYFRSELDLYVNVIHAKSYPGVPAKQQNLDVIIIRQNTEGEYAMLEHENVKGVTESMKVVTRENSERVVRYAFEYAKQHERKRVTSVHKSNILKLSDGLFLNTAEKVAKEYPGIEHNDMSVDNCCMQLVSKPHQFDVLVMTNLYGTILSNVVCGLVGGGGLLSGRNYGHYYAMFEPATRSSGISSIKENSANPTAMLNASADMLEYLGRLKHAGVIRKAIEKTICQDKIHTPDLKGTAQTTDVVNTVIDHVLETVNHSSWLE